VMVHDVIDWFDHLPTTEFGYRTTPPWSTSFSPCFFAYARHPTYLAQIKAMLDGAPMDLTSEASMVQLITHWGGDSTRRNAVGI